MNQTIVRKSKWFWPWQDASEEAWLEQMSRQGLHLTRARQLAQYDFIRGQSQEFTDRLDVQDSLKRKNKDIYLHLFTDDGWEYLGQSGGWQYFRKPVGSSGEREIFTDNESKIQKYNRFATWFGMIFPSYLVIFVALWNSWPEWMMWVNVGVILLLSTFWAFVSIKIAQRIKQLKAL